MSAGVDLAPIPIYYAAADDSNLQWEDWSGTQPSGMG